MRLQYTEKYYEYANYSSEQDWNLDSLHNRKDTYTTRINADEALAMVMGNTRVWSAGIYFDANQFTNRTYFAPYAFKYDLNTRKFHVEDLARVNKSEEVYTNQEWFKQLKSRWGNFYDNLEKHWLKMFFRSRSGGRDQSKFGDGTYDDIYLRRYEHFPEYYKAANFEQGIWTPPYFDCSGVGKPMWKITYASPFFG